MKKRNMAELVRYRTTAEPVYAEGRNLVLPDMTIVDSHNRQKIISSPGRSNRLMKAVSREELVEAVEAGMRYDEIVEMYNLASATDVTVLKVLYRLDIIEKRTGWNRNNSAPVVTYRVPASPALDDLSERLLQLTLEKLDSALDNRVKMAIARALHSAAEAIEEG